MKCVVCGQEATSYGLVTRKYEPCGHINNTESAKQQAEHMQRSMDFINKIAANLGLTGSSHRSSYIHWRIPRKWHGTRYEIGYTPWKTNYHGKLGFYAVKYRVTRKGCKLVKAVRFGKRKTAKARSLEWFKAYYEKSSLESAVAQ